ncbi:MAG TPA: cytochrome P450 [Stellaceae bacterium]|jgi:cytochrome P450|nr:cytochrome P450 [Stellaceae bacterium]
MDRVAETEAAPRMAMPPRPARPLSSLQLIRVARRNSIAACDEELFDEPIVERRFLWYRTFVLSDPEGIRRVLLDNFDNYPRVKQMRQVLAPGLGDGLLTAEGETWLRHRRLIGPMLDQRSVLSYAPMVAELAQGLAKAIAARPAGAYFNIADDMTRLLVAAIGRLFGDAKIEPLLQAFIENDRRRRVLDFLQVPSRLQFIYGRDAMRGTGHAFDPLLYELIAERRRPDYGGERDLLWRLVNTSDRTTSRPLSDNEARDEVVTLALGAVDTTMRGLSWVWYLLAMHPWAEARVEAEIETVLGNRVPSADDLPRLVFLRKAIDESLRLYPPIPAMLRTAAADDVLCGRRVPKGAIVAILPWVVHRHRKLWSEPDSFDPERFNEENSAARHRFAYLPFALGPRICVGASLAMMEMLLIVATLAQRFRFRLQPDRSIEPVGGFLTLRIDKGLFVAAEPRPARVAAA